MIIWICFLSSKILAQKINLDTLDIDQLNLYKDKAVTMRKTGLILTLAGIPVSVTGAILLANYVADDILGEDQSDSEGSLYGILFLGGAASTIVGIPLMIIGNDRKTKAELALKRFDLAPENSKAIGLGITLMF